MAVQNHLFDLVYPEGNHHCCRCHTVCGSRHFRWIRLETATSFAPAINGLIPLSRVQPKCPGRCRREPDRTCGIGRCSDKAQMPLGIAVLCQRRQWSASPEKQGNYHCRCQWSPRGKQNLSSCPRLLPVHDQSAPFCSRAVCATPPITSTVMRWHRNRQPGIQNPEAVQECQC